MMSRRPAARSLAKVLLLGGILVACASERPVTTQSNVGSSRPPAPVEDELRWVPAKEGVPPPWLSELQNHLRTTRGAEAPPLEISADGYHLFGHPVSDIAQVYERARKSRKEEHRVNGTPLLFDLGRLRYGKWVLYDNESEFIELAAEELRHRRSGEPGHMNLISAWGVRPLSLVGPVLTYETAYGCACAGGPPSSEVLWTTVDLTTQKPPQIANLVDRASLLSALAKDRCVAPLIAAADPPPRSLEEMLSLIHDGPPVSGDCFRAAEAFENFAFAGYEPDTDLVTLRLGFPYEISPGHLKTSYLGLLVRPLPTLRKMLQEVQKGEGFFMSDSDSTGP